LKQDLGSPSTDDSNSSKEEDSETAKERAPAELADLNKGDTTIKEEALDTE